MESLEEELLALDAIYPECIVREILSPQRLTIYPHGATASTSISLSIPEDYPNSIPSILGTSGISFPSAQTLLSESWITGNVCLYVLIDKLRELEYESEANVTQSRETRSKSPSINSFSDDESFQFAVSDPIVDRKSTFVGRSIQVHSKEEAQNALLWLKLHNKKISKATHNIVAWRILENGVLMQGYIYILNLLIW
jgi:Uncharacterized protein family UPF0029/RWD domain